VERFQHTIRHTMCAKGIGLHSGTEINMKIKPAPANTGVVFIRADLSPQVSIKLSPESIIDTKLCTALVKNNVKISTIEHVLSALAASEIDNIEIELSGAELPIMDGSSSPFSFLLDAAGRVSQKKLRQYKRILKPVKVQDGDKIAEFYPTDLDEFQLDFSIDFDHPVIADTPSEITYVLDSKTYSKEIGRARSFGFKKDLDMLRAHNLALGANLENVIGIDDSSVMNPEGLRYEDEFVRHKLLDAIGDLYAAGPILGRFRGHKSGHELNNKLLRELLKTPEAFEVVTVEEAGAEG
jgi:UDP-3-O-[3-hydroxymyristoyl] N-acetylglucosamine deacetylase